MTRACVTLLISVVGFLTGSQAMSQALIARSGEHDDFSRLVIEIPAGTQWSLTQQDRLARLKTNLPDVRYDTGQVFQRIPRSRLSNLTQARAGEPLEMELSCDCPVFGFVQSERYLVIDIKDPAPSTVTAERMPVVLPALPTRAPYRFHELDLRKADKPASKPGNQPNRERRPPHEAVPASGLPLIIEQGHSVTVPIMEIGYDFNNSISITQQRLLEQIGRASSQGLLVLREGHNGDQGVVPGSNAENDRAAPMNVSVTTAADRDLASVASRFAEAGSARPCTANERLNLSGWATDIPMSLQIGPLRSQLFGEFDRVSEQAVLDLTRLYLHFGFGLEALTTLSLLEDSTPETDLLSSIARIVDGTAAPATNPLRGQQHCPGEAALWSLLAARKPEPAVNTDAVQQAFFRLPDHLRSYLGPRIAEYFADAGDEGTAAAVLRAVERFDGGEVVAMDMARASLAHAAGDTQAELQHLETVVASDSDHSPLAIVALIETYFEEGGAVPPDLPDLVEAMALEHRKAAEGVALRQAATVALALAGRFEEADAALEDVGRRDGDAARVAVRASFLSLLEDRADDLVFLKHVLEEVSRGPEGLPLELGDSLADRLLVLGFADEAMAILEAKSDTPATEHRRLLRAQAALRLAKPHRALVELLGLDSPQANRLRASAMWMNGDFAAAGDLLLATNDTQAAARSFWMSQDFASIPGQDSAGYAIAAERAQVLAGAGAEVAQNPPLAQARALVEDSEGTRNRVAALLEGLASNEFDPGALLQPDQTD
ncbi:hypothetical protein LCL97_06790 [Seohaeicola saemankumensis]|nr:hypothetical protein [Seohaeicola saemankumensis]MCA0870523.1 hypothetical protein [Seohaeicola saemankumensis]